MGHSHSKLLGFVVLSLVLAEAGAASGQESSAPPRLTFTKALKGSYPEYLSISVDSTGSGNFEGRKFDDVPNPQPLRLSRATTQKLFALAESLGYFKSIDLESHRKVANLGSKTFTYEANGQKNRVEFNYSLRREAQELAAMFEKIAGAQQHAIELEHAMKYDHLSLPKELLQIQIDLDNKALVDPELMVPTLKEIARNPRFLHLAQVRAQNILQRLQSNN